MDSKNPITKNQLMNESVVLLGLGQQGRRVAQKLLALKESGHDIRLVAVFDPDPAKFSEDILPGKKLADLFPGAEQIASTIQHTAFNLDGITAIFDCSVTMRNGEDQHIANMKASVANGFNGDGRGGVYAVEKPASMSNSQLKEIVKKLPLNTIVLVDHVESFTQVKQATIRDIAKHKRDVAQIETFRLSATQDKSVKGERLIVRDFGGAWHDKAHDPMHAANIILASHGEMRNPQVVFAEFDILEIVSPNGARSAVNNKGQFVPMPELTARQRRAMENAEQHAADGWSYDAPNASYWEREAGEMRRNAVGKTFHGLSEAYADVSWTASDVYIHHVASHLGAKPHDLEEIESWFTQPLKIAVAEASEKRGQPRAPESVTAAYGVNFQNLEARVAKIECSDGTVYVEQTFAVGGGFFSARINPDETVDILYEGAHNAPENDGIMNWVRNALASRAGYEEPMSSLEAILGDSRIIHEVDEVANRLSVWTLDLSDPSQQAFAKFLEEPLQEANCWTATSVKTSQ